MKTNTFIKFSVLFLLALMIAHAASAVIDVNTYPLYRDFSVTTASAISACSCAGARDPITITNLASYDVTFTLSADTTAVTFSENAVVLAPQESRTVSATIAADCSTGTQEYEISVKSNLGLEKRFAKTITTTQCQNIEMRLKTMNSTVLPCSPARFLIFVTNVGPFSEDYSISSNHDAEMKYSARTFTLQPNTTAQVNASVTFDCSIFGSKDITFTTRSIKNGLTASIDSPITIDRAGYNFDILFNNKPLANDTPTATVQVCNRVYRTLIPLTIINSGSVDNTFTITTKSLPKYITLNDVDREISLKAGESKTVYFSADTQAFRYENAYDAFTVTIKSKLGDIKKEQRIGVNHLLCYEHTISIAGIAKNSEKNPIFTVANSLYSYDVTVKNLGMYTEDIALSIQGAPSGVALSQKSITVKSGESKTVRLFITGPDTNEIYHITVTAALKNQISETSGVWIKSFDVQESHKIAITKNLYRINYQTAAITIPVKNTGISDGTYTVRFNGNPMLTLNTSQVTLNAGESKTVTLLAHTNNISAGDYSGTLTLVHTDSQASYSTPITVRLKDKSVFTKAWEFFAFGTVCRQFSLIEIILILLAIAFIIFIAIRGPHYPYKFWNRVRYKLPILAILALVFVFGVVLVILFAGLPKTQGQVYNLTQDYDTLRFQMVENGQFSINAAKYFSDPDNNTLVYSINRSRHIGGVVEKNMVTFVPARDWFGTEAVSIIADDRQGGTAQSPQITLTVVEAVKRSQTELYTIYCWYINLAYFAIILGLVFLAVIIRQKKRVRKK